MKKATCLLLALCLLLAIIPASTLAQEAESQDYQNKTVIIYTANLRGDITVLPQVAYLRQHYIALGADVALVDLGNYLQGTIYATYDSGKTLLSLMEATGYDVLAIGSHEFNFGTAQIGVETHGIIHEDDTLGYLLENASFYAVASNIVAGEDALHAFGENAVITATSGREIAFFGITCPNTSNQVLESNLDGLTFQNPHITTKEQVLALNSYDLVIGLGNTGRPMAIRGAIVLDIPQSAQLTVGVLVVDNDTNQVLSNTILDLAGNYCPEVLAAVNQARAIAQEAFPNVATSLVTLEGRFSVNRAQQTNTGTLWADALRWFALYGGIENFFDEDDIEAGNTGIMVDPAYVVAVWNGGNLRDFLNTGDVTMRDLQRVLPFPNRVAVMYITGYQLLEMIEAATQGLPFTQETFQSLAAFPHVSGIDFTVDTTIPFDAGEAYGNHWYRANSLGRVTIHSINGNAFNPNATYAIITSNAIFNGMDSNYISLERDQEYSTITSAFVVDAVWQYIMQELGGVIQ